MVSDLQLAQNGAVLHTNTCDQKSPRNASFPFLKNGLIEEPVTGVRQPGHSQSIVSRVMGFWRKPFYNRGSLLSVMIITLDFYCLDQSLMLILGGLRNF